MIKVAPKMKPHPSAQRLTLASRSGSKEISDRGDQDILLSLLIISGSTVLALISAVLAGSPGEASAPLLSAALLSAVCFVSDQTKAMFAAFASALTASGVFFVYSGPTDAALVLMVMLTTAVLLKMLHLLEGYVKADRGSAHLVIITLIASVLVSTTCLAMVYFTVNDGGSFGDCFGLVLCSVLPALFVRAALLARIWCKKPFSGFFDAPSRRRRIAEYTALVIYSVGISFSIEYLVAPYAPMVLLSSICDFLVILYFYRRSFANLGVALTIMFTAGNFGYALDGFDKPLLFAAYIGWAYFLAGIIIVLRTIELGAGRDIIRAEAEAEASRESARIAVAQAEAHEKALANLTHDLKSPIAAVQGLLDWTRQRSKRNENVSELIHLATSQINRLGDLVNNVLEMSHAELDQQKIRYEPVNLQELLGEVVNDFSLIAKNKGLKLGLDIEPGAVTHISHDGLRLRRMISNLVDNACKYTETGGITIKLQTSSVDTQLVGVTIAVKDTGVGVPTADKEAIFEKFVRAQNRGSSEGLGIGLSIVANMAATIGASLSLDSKEGEGSSFSIDFVASAGDLAPTAEVAMLNERKPGAQILIVEDDPIHARITCSVLSDYGTVQIAENGAEALEAMAKKKFDLVFMDCRMPVLDGYSTTAEIRAFEGAHDSRGIPIVGLTSNATTNERRRALDSGMNVIYAKPMTPSIADEALGLIAA